MTFVVSGPALAMVGGMWKFKQALGLVKLDYDAMDAALDAMIEFLERIPPELQDAPMNDPRVLEWARREGLL